MIDRQPSEVDRLVNEHMAIAINLANQWHWYYSSDALSIALEGLLAAAQSWDASRGIPFPQYACSKIKFHQRDVERRDKAVKRGGRVEHVALNQLFCGSQDEFIADVVPDEKMQPPDEAVIAAETKAMVEALLKTLDSRSRKILRERFGLDQEPRKLLHIASDLEVDYTRAWQIKKEALAKLRKQFRSLFQSFNQERQPA